MNYINLDDGLAIYLKNNSKNYYVYLYQKGEQVRKSLRTADLAEATRLAWREKITAEIRQNEGLGLQSRKTSVKSLAEKVIKELKKQKSTKNDL